LLELDLAMRVAMDAILIISMVKLALGYYSKSKNKHIYRMVGLVLFGIFWLLSAPRFFQIGDLFNGIVVILAMPFYVFLGYNEYLSYKWGEEIPALKWIVGASFVGAGIYFLVDKVPILSGAMIYVVAQQTVWILNSLGFDYGVGTIAYGGNPLWYRTNYYEISVPITYSSVAIIQACTALQSMLIFVGAIFSVKAPTKRKWQAFFATVPVIYVLNLIRNVSVIYMLDELSWDYNMAHNVVGKGGSFVALLVLAFVTFKLLPELLDNIWALVDLSERKKKEGEGQGDEEEPEGEGEDVEGKNQNEEMENQDDIKEDETKEKES
jgi:archaeosortase A (PGF-CTERM-specific)